MSNFDWLAAQGWQAAAHGDFDFSATPPAPDETIAVPLAQLGKQVEVTHVDRFFQP